MMRQYQRKNDKCRHRHRAWPAALASVRLLVLSVGAAVLVAGTHPPSAHAGIADQVSNWFALPGQVDELRDQYDQTKQQLDDVTKQFEETVRQSQETVDRYQAAEQQLRQDNEQLARQNEQLAKQNEQLSQAIDGLQQAEQQRTERSRRMWMLIWTAVGLVGLYFLSSRLFRLLLRSKHS